MTASLDRNSVRVGELVDLTLNYRLPEGSTLPQEVEVRGLEEISIVERVKEPGQIRIKFLLDRLGSWTSGVLGLAYVDGEKRTHYLETAPVSLTVLSNLGDKPVEAELRPIQGILPTSSAWAKYVPWGLGFLVLLLAGAGLWWWHKKKYGWEEFTVVADPAHIRAMKQIEQLEERGLFEKGEIKEFYFIFTEIVRHYLGFLRGFPAAEFTTEEIARHLHNEQDRTLLPLLREADLVKFADRIPTPARKDEDVKTALSYIRETSSIVENNRAKVQVVSETGERIE
jgi:hypothetical protein